MKAILLLTLSLFASQAHASRVGVVIDGNFYGCGPEQEMPDCTCRLEANGNGTYSYRILYQGIEISRNENRFYKGAGALAACKTEVRSLEGCH